MPRQNPVSAHKGHDRKTMSATASLKGITNTPNKKKQHSKNLQKMATKIQKKNPAQTKENGQLPYLPLNVLIIIANYIAKRDSNDRKQLKLVS